MSFHAPEQFRQKIGMAELFEGSGVHGAFVIPFEIKGGKASILRVFATDNFGWEHVSVSLATRCPTWDEMCLVKDLFWGEEDTVIQYHPPRSEYVNVHPYCLHLWRQVGKEFVRPDSLLVGPSQA